MESACCLSASPRSISEFSSFRAPTAGSPIRACYRFQTILRVARILPSISRTHKHSLSSFFKQNGYFESQVNPEVTTDADRGLVNVIFHVDLNRRAKFGKVILSGTPPDEEPKLQQALKSWRARLRGSAIRQGKSYSLRAIQNATRYLEGQLISRDYLGSRVQMAGAEYDPTTHRADVRFDVTLGETGACQNRGRPSMGTYTKEAVADLSNRWSGSRTDSGEPRKSYLTLPNQRLFRRRCAVRCSAFAKRTNHTVSRYQRIAAQSDRGCRGGEPQAFRRSASRAREGGEGADSSSGAISASVWSKPVPTI